MIYSTLTRYTEFCTNLTVFWQHGALSITTLPGYPLPHRSQFCVVLSSPIFSSTTEGGWVSDLSSERFDPGTTAELACLAGPPVEAPSKFFRFQLFLQLAIPASQFLLGHPSSPFSLLRAVCRCPRPSTLLSLARAVLPPRTNLGLPPLLGPPTSPRSPIPLALLSPVPLTPPPSSSQPTHSRAHTWSDS
jgi:hypothetical protein